MDRADLVVAADGGLAVCRAVGVWPHELIGDLDSVTAELVDEARTHGVRVHEFARDKNETDLELAVSLAIEAGVSELTAVAAFGGRLDHELATIALLASERLAHVSVEATDGRRWLAVVRTHRELALPVGAIVSLIPWAGPVTGVTTSGLHWPLGDATLPLGTTRGISNVASTARQSVSITSGVLLAVSDSG